MCSVTFFSVGKKKISDSYGEVGDYDGELDMFGNACGEGLIKYEDGYTYRGTFANNERHGYGVLMYNGGGKAEGEFKFGEPHSKRTDYRR